MIEQSNARIYVAGERGHTETGWFRSYNTFNFGNYQSEHKKPFGALYVCNEDTLAPGKSFSLVVEHDSDIILLPTVGVVACKAGDDAVVYTEAGQVLVKNINAGTTVQFSNPLEGELNNFLQLWLSHPSVTGESLMSFDLQEEKNTLVQLLNHPNLKLCIGKYTGRQEFEYCVQDRNKGLFAFVIEGAFEVEYRLLETKDGLALWDIDKIEVEALSGDAIILLAEVPMLFEVLAQRTPNADKCSSPNCGL
jgi:redox-sensitive bicupin YhaK (pirin superfamily)